MLIDNGDGTGSLILKILQCSAQDCLKINNKKIYEKEGEVDAKTFLGYSKERFKEIWRVATFSRHLKHANTILKFISK